MKLTQQVQVAALQTISTFTKPTDIPVLIYTKQNIDQNFNSANFIGSAVVITKFTISSTGFWYPLNFAKFFCVNFYRNNNNKPNEHN